MRARGEQRLSRWVYRVALILALFTGFGNMPLYGRYYVADVPWLTWSGDFITNVKVHYMAGAILLAIGVYYLFGYFWYYERRRKVTATGKVRAFLLVLTLLSGIVMAIKNLPGVVFPLDLLVGMNFLHMGSALFLMLVTLVAIVMRSKWVRRAR